MSPQVPLPGLQPPLVSASGPSGPPESRPSAQPPAPPGSPRHCCAAGPALGSRGRPRTSRAGGDAGLLGSCCPPVLWWVAACLTALGSRPLPRGPPHNLLVLCGHTHRTAGPLHVHTGPLGARQATTSWGRGLPSRGRSQAGSSCLGWLVPPRVVLAYVPGGPTSPWGGLGPSQAGKGWGPRDGFQGCGPQALTAQALPRGCGRRQRQGALAFLLPEECGSGSPHTMVHVGPGRAGGQDGGTRPSLPLWQGQWKAVVGQVPGRLAAGRQATTHHRGT